MTILDFAVISISCFSAFFDLTIRKIPNWLIAIGVVSGLAISAFEGRPVFLLSLLGLIAGIAILIPPFAMGWIGAGDVKFLGVAGCLMGLPLLPRIFFYSAMAAGVIALSSLILGKIRFFSFKQLWLDVRIALVSFGRVVPPSVGQRVARRDESVPWGVAFAAGMLIAYYVDSKGQWAGF